MDSTGNTQTSVYDVIVVGAGPAGCEASLAAAWAGANTLCLTINLDTVGFPPASPIIVDNGDDPRGRLLDELAAIGGRLPSLLSGEGISRREADGRLLCDRRELGLSYKEALESRDRLELRQSLVTSVSHNDGVWTVETRLGERFAATCIVIAAGTFLGGEVYCGGLSYPGGRRGEIPSNALADCLQQKGYALSRITAQTPPRLAGASSSPAGNSLQNFPPDGSQLSERFAYGFETIDSASEQLFQIKKYTGNPSAWISRPGYAVSHLVLSQCQCGLDLSLPGPRGIFAAGRFAGSCNYLEAAALGVVSGEAAAGAAAGREVLIDYPIFVSKLLELTSGDDERPVTIRVEGPGC